MPGANEEYVIDVMVNAIDNAKATLTEAQKYVSQFDKYTNDVTNKMAARSRTPFDLTVRGIDKASSVMDNIDSRGQSLVRRPFDLTVRGIDKASTVMDKIYARGESLVKRPLEITIKAKDLATAPLTKTVDMLSSYQAMMLAGAATAVGAATIAWPLKLADNLQSANIAFTTMLGSAQKAQQFMAQVQQFAIATPFSTEDIVKNAQFMMALGFKYNQIIPSLQAIGDAASAMGGSADIIQRIILALGQMQAHGKVDAQDMLQLTSANIPAWQILADKLHLTVAQVQQLAQAGKLEAAPAVQALIQGMEKLYGGQMQKNANATFGGLMSQIADTFRIDIVTKWGQGLEKATLPALSKFNDWLGRNQQLVSSWGQSLENVAAQGAQWVVDKVQELASAVNAMVNSPAWKNAPTFWDKMKVGWDTLIVQPFDKWWSGIGQQQVAKMAGQVGGFFGSTLNGIMMGALGLVNGKGGSQSQTFADAGQTAGSAFFNAFAKSFHADQIARSLIDAFKNIQPSFLGGKSNSLGGDLLSLGLDFLLLRKGIKITRGIAGDVTSVRNGWRSVRNVGRKVGGLFKKKPPKGPGEPPSAALKHTIREAAPASEPKMSGILDKHGRMLPSVLHTTEKGGVLKSTIHEAESAVSKGASLKAVSKVGGVLSKVRAVGRRIPGLNLLFGGMDILSGLSATTREGKFMGVGSGIGGTIGSIAGGALGSLLGPVGNVVGGMIGDTVGSWVGKNAGKLISKIPWDSVGRNASKAFGHVTKFFSDAYDTSTKWVSRMVSDVPSMFAKLPGPIRDTLNAIWEFITNPLQAVSDGVKTIVNGVLSGYNWIASKLGLSTIPLWGGITFAAVSTGFGSGASSNPGVNVGTSTGPKIAAFAKGVNDWSGGLALVGEEGPELVYLPAHSSVLPNHQTRRFIPGFKNGVGDFFKQVGSDILGLITSGPSALVSAALKAIGVQKPSFPPLFSDIGGAIFGNAVNGLVDWANNHIPKVGGSSGGSGGPPPGVKVPGNLVQWLTQAMQLTGTPMTWFGALEQIALHESSGNPYAINNWDSNAKAGTPSKGLMQVIDPTFQQYALPGHTDIWNPVDNAAAAIRYMDARYGSIGNVPGIVSLSNGGPYKGYATGGKIYEPILGVGLKSGKRYAFGEKGPETIVPNGVTANQTASVPVNLNGVTIQITVNAPKATSGEDVVKAIDEHMAEITDKIAYQLAKGLNRSFANMTA